MRQAIVSIAITCFLFWLFPALGPAPAPWTADMLSLRAGSPMDLQLLALKGIISFPSYHAVLGILLIHAFRGTPLSPAIIALNSLMILAALNISAHYLADIIAGFFVALLSILALGWIGSIRWLADATFHPVSG